MISIRFNRLPSALVVRNGEPQARGPNSNPGSANLEKLCHFSETNLAHLNKHNYSCPAYFTGWVIQTGGDTG